MSDSLDVAVWATPGVNGDGVTLTVHGQVALIHTGDLLHGVAIDDMWFAKRTPGAPVEMNRTQLQELRRILDQAIEAIVDENDLGYRYEPGAHE